MDGTELCRYQHIVGRNNNVHFQLKNIYRMPYPGTRPRKSHTPSQESNKHTKNSGVSQETGQPLHHSASWFPTRGSRWNKTPHKKPRISNPTRFQTRKASSKQ